jgi:2-desacetyl-2-hydroxyethyl bacteriochlorophyllide A dehydrogenase
MNDRTSPVGQSDPAAAEPGVCTTSSALVVVRPGAVELAEVGVREPAPNEVIIRAEYSGISTGTDRWVAQGRFDWGVAEFPLVPGYQKAGYVVQAGDGDQAWIGRPVFAASARDFIGVAAGSGGHAQYSNHALDQVYALSGPPSPLLALGVSVQVGYNAAHRIQRDRVRRVAVIGDGVIGVSGALAALDRGFDVAVVGHHDDRLDVARQAGGTGLTGNSVAADLAAFGPEAIIDTVQSADSFELVIHTLPADYGQVVYSGFTPGLPDAWASMTRLQQRSITAHFQSGWTRERLAKVLQTIEDDETALHQLPVSQIPADHCRQAFDDLITGAQVPLASVIRWSDHT